MPVFLLLWSLILLNNHRSPAELPGRRDVRSHASLPTADERMPGARPRGRAGTGTSPGALVCVCDVYGFQKIMILRGCLLPKLASAGKHLPEKETVQEVPVHRTCFWVWGRVPVFPAPLRAGTAPGSSLPDAGRARAGSPPTFSGHSAASSRCLLLPPGCPLGL